MYVEILQARGDGWSFVKINVVFCFACRKLCDNETALEHIDKTYTHTYVPTDTYIHMWRYDNVCTHTFTINILVLYSHGLMFVYYKSKNYIASGQAWVCSVKRGSLLPSIPPINRSPLSPCSHGGNTPQSCEDTVIPNRKMLLT